MLDELSIQFFHRLFGNSSDPLEVEVELFIFLSILSVNVSEKLNFIMIQEPIRIGNDTVHKELVEIYNQLTSWKS